jgi:DNA repair protein RadC
MTKFKKGSAEAKRFMAKLRAMKGKTTAKKSVNKSKIGYKDDRLSILKKGTKYMKKYKEMGYDRKDSIKNSNLDASYVGKVVKKKTTKTVGAAKKVKSRTTKKIKFNPKNLNANQDKYKYMNKYYEVHEDMDGDPYLSVPGGTIYFTGIGAIKKAKPMAKSLHKDTKSHNVNIRVLSGYKQTPEVIVGKIGSITILKSLVPEVKLRITRGKKVSTNQITSARDISEILKKFITPSKIQTQEYALALFLNNNNNVLAVYQFGMGGFTSTVMDKRLLMAAALKLGATGIILCHNHPSGSLVPSDADKRVTKAIQEIARLHDMNVLDHVILTKTGYYSFAEKGLI